MRVWRRERGFVTERNEKFMCMTEKYDNKSEARRKRICCCQEKKDKIKIMW